MMKPILTKATLLVTLAAAAYAARIYLDSSHITAKEQRNTPAAETVKSGNTDIPVNRDDKNTLPLFRTWETFGKKDGLPSDKITSVRIGRDRVWVGTDKGLALYRNGEWTVITTDEGLSHNYILGIDVNEKTGEVWIATMAGLNRWSAGKIEVYSQFNSGLANDVVYAVLADDQYVWTATAAGASRYDTYTDQWSIFDTENAPMHEPWTYGIADGGDKIYIAAWGGGVIEYFKESGRFRVHRDPDHQMEIDLYPDDGIVHDVITGASYQNGVLWVGSYFGMSRYDGTHWQSYFEEDSGLASNFINFIKAHESVVYICTDKGLSTFDGTRWATYYSNELDAGGEIRIREGDQTTKLSTSSSLPDNYIWAMDIRGEEIWVATANGVSHSRSSAETARL